ncbi:GrxA family glutaredoxin [Candidatus Fukatsuia symbiotica]|uniref:GrxA family glutaredoxin n=1 Tax=Candidatus Fukatsuia symbiotica TaxID=1878942 RepID=A0A2U8I3T7_9GAMM|nr:GrxA family glutaredoxin [Candidatus Fukatsuia symbiotica]AWK13783.1 GrxA family glutaredoxin [Candidatus Fukatsuia symbiotica]MEA9445969.1 GrxA family glutaredoxin [Candidatus Fukatsuia symbiotica]
MYTVIFGRPGCPFCVRAQELAKKLAAQRNDFKFSYIDIHAEGISKADLEKSVGKPVETVPQIFIDKQHIGGCTDFEAYAKKYLCQTDQTSASCIP